MRDLKEKVSMFDKLHMRSKKMRKEGHSFLEKKVYFLMKNYLRLFSYRHIFEKKTRKGSRFPERLEKNLKTLQNRKLNSKVGFICLWKDLIFSFQCQWSCERNPKPVWDWRLLSRSLDKSEFSASISWMILLLIFLLWILKQLIKF